MRTSRRRVAARTIALLLAALVGVSACGSSGSPAAGSPTQGQATPDAGQANPTPGPMSGSPVPSAGTAGSSLPPSSPFTLPPTPSPSWPPGPSPTPGPGASPTPSASPPPTQSPAPTPPPTPTPSASPVPSPSPSVDLTATLGNSWALDTDWRPTAALGTAAFEITIANPATTQLYPVCRITVTAGNPARRKHLAWSGGRPLGPLQTSDYRLQIARVPMAIGAGGFATFAPHEVICRGVLQPPSGAAADAPEPLHSFIVKTHGTRPVLGRSTITVTWRVENTTERAARPGCRVQIAGTRRTIQPILAGEAIAVYRYDSDKVILPGDSTTLSYTALNAPVKVANDGGWYWLWTVRCWAR